MTPHLPGNAFTITPFVYGRHLKVESLTPSRLSGMSDAALKESLTDLWRTDTYFRATDPVREQVKSLLSTELESRNPT